VPHRCVLLGLLLLLFPVAGCALMSPGKLGWSPSSERRARLSVQVEEQFTSCRSLEEVKLRLARLDQSRDAQQQAEALISGWGKHGDWYDLAVVEFLLEHWPSAYGLGADYGPGWGAELGPDWERYDSRRLFDVTQEVLNARPDLVYQVFWYRQWQRGLCDFPSLMRDLETQSSSCVRIEGDQYPMLLFTAGIASGLPADVFSWGLMSGVDFETLELNRRLINGYVTSQRPFLRYDHELGRYVVDRVAKDENRYLSPEEQVASPRATPLPGWSSGPVTRSKEATPSIRAGL
jgi:hypothetical protein